MDLLHFSEDGEIEDWKLTEMKNMEEIKINQMRYEVMNMKLKRNVEMEVIETSVKH